MPQDTYSKSEIDLKLDKSILIQTRLEKIDLKFDQLKQEMGSFEKIDLSLTIFENDVRLHVTNTENKRFERSGQKQKSLCIGLSDCWLAFVLGILAIIVTILTAK